MRRPKPWVDGSDTSGEEAEGRRVSQKKRSNSQRPASWAQARCEEARTVRGRTLRVRSILLDPSSWPCSRSVSIIQGRSLLLPNVGHNRSTFRYQIPLVVIILRESVCRACTSSVSRCSAAWKDQCSPIGATGANLSTSLITARTYSNAGSSRSVVVGSRLFSATNLSTSAWKWRCTSGCRARARTQEDMAETVWRVVGKRVTHIVGS